MKLGNQSGCLSNDKIDFELSPAEVYELICFAEEEAVDAVDYITQRIYRSLKDKLQCRHDDWRAQRDAKDEMTP